MMDVDEGEEVVEEVVVEMQGLALNEEQAQQERRRGDQDGGRV